MLVPSFHPKLPFLSTFNNPMCASLFRPLGPEAICVGVVLSMTWDIYIGKLRSSLIAEQLKAGSVSLVFCGLGCIVF